VRWLAALAVVCVTAAPPAGSAGQPAASPAEVEMPQSLTGAHGDAARGRAIVANRQVGLCLLCHSGPFPEEPLQGNLAPDLRGAGSRWPEAVLRHRLVAPAHYNPETIMPAYQRTEGLARVAPAFQGKPLLTAQQVEDVVAFLLTLRD